MPHPAGLTPDVTDGKAFVSVVIAEHEALRPAQFPSCMGTDFTQVAYRAIVQAPNGARGVHPLRSDADSLWPTILGNLFSNCNFHLADAVWSGKSMLKAVAANPAAVELATSAHFMLEPRGPVINPPPPP